jgi:hypothetical protein
MSGVAIGGKRQADVVDGDRDAHSGFELREQGIAAERMIERVADRCLAIRQSLDRWIGVQNARSDG